VEVSKIVESTQLVAKRRETINKGSTRALRRSGRIPAILYGDGVLRAVSIDAKEWAHSFQYASGNKVIGLKLDNDEYKVLVKDTQRDILSGGVMHIDFYAIRAGKKLSTVVPIHLEGTPKGIIEGGILEQKIEEIEVVCLPEDIPDFFAIDVSQLEVGDSLHVSDIPTPREVEIRTDVHLTVVVITHAKAVEEPVSEIEEEVVEEIAIGDGSEEGAE